jgi:hypothetical protein
VSTATRELFTRLSAAQRELYINSLTQNVDRNRAHMILKTTAPQVVKDLLSLLAGAPLLPGSGVIISVVPVSFHFRSGGSNQKVKPQNRKGGQTMVTGFGESALFESGTVGKD